MLYVTAEESTGQVRERCQRLQATADGFAIAATSDAEAVAGALATGDHDLVVLDSIQLVTLPDVDGVPGSPRRCAPAPGRSSMRPSEAALLL